MSYRIGLGYDVHPFESSSRLILGGMEIPHVKGLKGHSDADVLLHAVIDAILGAAALGDIGTHFPDTDPLFKGADSSELLSYALSLVNKAGFEIENIDTTIVAEVPKLNPFIVDIRENIAGILKCDVDRVSVKATTSEKMGFVGRGEGIAVHAIALLKKLS